MRELWSETKKEKKNSCGSAFFDDVDLNDSVSIQERQESSKSFCGTEKKCILNTPCQRTSGTKNERNTKILQEEEVFRYSFVATKFGNRRWRNFGLKSVGSFFYFFSTQHTFFPPFVGVKIDCKKRTHGLVTSFFFFFLKRTTTVLLQQLLKPSLIKHSSAPTLSRTISSFPPLV